MPDVNNRKLIWADEKNHKGKRCSNCGWIAPWMIDTTGLNEDRSAAVEIDTRKKFDEHECAKYPQSRVE